MYEYVIGLKISDLYKLLQLQIHNKCYASENMDYFQMYEAIFFKELESQINQVEY
jgi:hypothetical protein